MKEKGLVRRRLVTPHVSDDANELAHYFARHYAKLTYPIESAGHRGFRQAQLAALDAINAHLYSRSELPGIVVMPTGSGKTIVMNAAAFRQRARRILVLTPSRLVREQIAEGFETLGDLIEIGALPVGVPKPRVFSTRGRVGTDQAWESLRDYDVVVATVPSVSGKEIPEPPQDLFDLILVDEAHHVPAASWKKILDRFPGVRRVHFTATPFRNDEREIEGKLIFTYDIRRAHQDGVFGKITFAPVSVASGQSHDMAIAMAAETQLRADHAAGLKHLLMVRTDSRKRANELKKIYEEHTKLKLRLVASNQSLSHVKRVVKDLREFKVDGVICVNMLAEGFNLPNLKVAAIHAPHRSLAVTLQFIGRFARTTSADLGTATFLAVPSDISIETTKLFREGAIWSEIVPNLSASRLAEELRVREYLDTFDKAVVPDLADFSLYGVAPYYHVKILEAPEGVDLTRELDFPPGLTRVYRGESAEHQSVIYVTREAWPSPWSDDERLENVQFDMFLLHYHAPSHLLFICATRRNASIYDRLADGVSLGRMRPLSLARLNRVLNNLEGLEFFNLGMRNRSAYGSAESYRTLAGPAADKAVQPSDGRMYSRGHCFGRAIEAGSAVTIGISSASKVWSNASGSIPDLIGWCDRLAQKIHSTGTPITRSGIDYLSAGEELSEIPAGVHIACWHKGVYLDPPLVRYQDSDGRTVETDLLDLDLRVVSATADYVRISLSANGREFQADFTLDGDRLFVPTRDDQPSFEVSQGRDYVPVIDFLNDAPLSFYTSDLSRIEGDSLFPTPNELAPFDVAHFETVDWAASNVAIDVEKPPAPLGRLSIFEWLENRLTSSPAEIVFVDDGAGEMADYITMEREGEDCIVTLYHCKASGRVRPGRRVGDAYDVCGQAVRSTIWARPRAMLDRIAKRLRTTNASAYVKGNHDIASALLGESRVSFRIVIVQPGFARASLAPAIANLLAATNDYLVRGSVAPLRIIGS